MGNTNKLLTFYYIDNSYIEHLIKDIDDRVAFNKANLQEFVRKAHSFRCGMDNIWN